MWKPLDKHFEWAEPEYEILDEKGIHDTLDLIMDREHWILASNYRREEWEDRLVGVIQTSPARRTNYVYGSERRTRIVRPKERFKPIPNRRIRPGDELTGNLRIAKLEPAQFYGLRSNYLNANIKMVSPPGIYAFAVLDGDVLIGAFGYLDSKYAVDEQYLVSDFPVGGTDYPRLSKLIVLAATSAEAQFILQNARSRRLNRIATTAFAKNPVSMKYRGILELTKREDSTDPHWNYQLQYEGPIGTHTLAEAWDTWSTRWGKKK